MPKRTKMGRWDIWKVAGRTGEEIEVKKMSESLESGKKSK